MDGRSEKESGRRVCRSKYYYLAGPYSHELFLLSLVSPRILITIFIRNKLSFVIYFVQINMFLLLSKIYQLFKNYPQPIYDFARNFCTGPLVVTLILTIVLTQYQVRGIIKISYYRPRKTYSFLLLS